MLQYSRFMWIFLGETAPSMVAHDHDSSLPSPMPSLSTDDHSRMLWQQEDEELYLPC